ncbi:hypothetical protein ATR1_075c0044, partial [Acetobacter tropicalis]
MGQIQIGARRAAATVEQAANGGVVIQPEHDLHHIFHPDEITRLRTIGNVRAIRAEQAGR